MTYQRPKTITLKFNQKRFDHEGTITDQDNRTIFRLHDEGKDTTLDTLRYYPLQILRTIESPTGTLIATLNWHSSSSTCSITGLHDPSTSNAHNKTPIKGGILDDNLAFTFGGSKYEWDGVWGHIFRLFDYQILTRDSIVPAVRAEFRPRSVTGGVSELELHEEVLRTRGLVEVLVVTCIWLEYEVHCQDEGKSNNKAAFKFGKALGQTAFSAGDAGGV